MPHALCFRPLLSTWRRPMLMLELDRDDIRLGGVGVDWRGGVGGGRARRAEGAGFAVKAPLQAILVDAHGDPGVLREEHPTFRALTDGESWRRSRGGGGGTAGLRPRPRF